MSKLKPQRQPKAMKIVCIDPGARYAIHSASGQQYEIRYAGSGDADPEYVALWECSCPAAQYGRDCKHLALFLGSRLTDDEHDEGDALAVDAHGNTTWEPSPGKDGGCRD